MVAWSDYSKESIQARLKILELIHKAQVSHIGSNFSCVDLMAVIFAHLDFKKDVFCLSKGWAAASLYYFLWRRGRMTLEELNSFCMPGSKYIGLAEPVHPDIKIAGGSMGLSFPGAVGLAMAKKLKGEEGNVYVLMSDGEQAIGTTWESALIAAHHKLDNLIVIVDLNRFQAMGKTFDILKIAPLQSKWAEFGWSTRELSGHDFKRLDARFFDVDYEKETKKPQVIIANTVKGKGVSFMENVNLFHYKQLSDDEYHRAKNELEEQLIAWAK